MRVCLAVGLTAMCLCSCGWLVTGDPEAEAAFVESLRTVVRGQGDISQFDLAEATSFDWRIAHVFRPYTSDEVVNKATGTKVQSRALDYRDDINLFVFARSGEVVLTVEVPRGVCDFEHPADKNNAPLRIANDKALFQVAIDDTGWCRAKPVDVMRN